MQTPPPAQVEHLRGGSGAHIASGYASLHIFWYYADRDKQFAAAELSPFVLGTCISSRHKLIRAAGTSIISAKGNNDPQACMSLRV